MKRAETDREAVPYPTTSMGQSQTFADDDCGPHVFLYVPDISVETGWSSHRVPDRKPERVHRRVVGFRR